MREHPYQPVSPLKGPHYGRGIESPCLVHRPYRTVLHVPHSRSYLPSQASLERSGVAAHRTEEACTDMHSVVYDAQILIVVTIFTFFLKFVVSNPGRFEEAREICGKTLP